MKAEKVESKKTPGTYTFKFSVSLSEYHRLENDCVGLCIACGESQGDCEPDARRYDCEACGERRVYGHEELILLNRLIVGES